MYRLISLAALTFFSFSAIADCTSLSCNNVYVEKLYLTTSGTVYIGTSGNETQLTCNAAGGVYTTLNLSNPGANAIYSTLLTAQTSNKVVEIRIEENSIGCNILYMTLEKQ